MTAEHKRRRRLLLAAGVVGLLIVAAGIFLLLRKDDVVGVDPAWLSKPPSGVVRYCTGKDVSHSQQESVDAFNKRFRGQARAELVESARTADAQRAEYLQILGQKTQDDCDIVYLDVAYMAEFADKDLLYDMSPYLGENDLEAAFDKRMITSARYDDRLWGVPKQLDAGVMVYRTDKGLHAPTSWADVAEQAQQRGELPGELPGLRFQAATYEGLTVIFLELAYSAGAQPIISEDGEVDIDQEPAVRAVAFMRDAIKNGAVPDQVINQIDEGSLFVFERARAVLMRSWPYAVTRIRGDAEQAVRTRDPEAAILRQTANNFKVAPLPPWTLGGEHVTVLGGHDLVIARNAANPRAALHLVRFLTSYPQVRHDATRYSQFPVLTDLADDPDVLRDKTIAAITKTTVTPRPVISNYADVSKIISKGLKELLDPHDLADSGDDEAAIRDKLASIEQEVKDAL